MSSSSHLKYAITVDPDDSLYRNNYVDDLEGWDHSKSFFVNIGSVFNNTFGYKSNYEDEQILKSVATICKSTWSWSWDEYNVLEQGTNHTHLTAVDVVRRVWFHFDSKDDAMLCRITLVDLRSARHAVSGRVPRGTE